MSKMHTFSLANRSESYGRFWENAQEYQEYINAP